MVQWMHCMADKAHKQEVYAMHTYSDMHSITWWPYSTIISIHIISSSKLVSTNWRATAIYVYRDGCWIMWPCYGVHISLCAWHFLIVCVLFQPCSAFIDGAIPISDRFLFGNLFMETCFCSFLVNVDIDTFQSISSEEVCKKISPNSTRSSKHGLLIQTRIICGWCIIIYIHCSSSTLLTLYKLLVHPILEYAAVIWDPVFHTNSNSLESVQHFTLKIVSKSWFSDYSSLLLWARGSVAHM